MEVRTEIFFAVRGLWVQRDLLSSTVPLKRAGFEIEIRFPPFGAGHEIPDGPDIAGSSGTPGDPQRWVELTRVLVVLRSDNVEIKSVDQCDIVSNYEQSALKVATDALSEFLDWVRLSGQFWLGVMGERPEREQRQRTYQESSNLRFNVGFGGAIVVQAREESAKLTADRLKDISQRLIETHAVPVPESFLMDGLSLREAGHRSDIQRAVVMAAIACEMKVQQVLREKVSDERRGLVAIILKNHREIETAKLLLFHSVMKEALGCSMHESTPKLYAKVKQLIEMRNKIVHEGKLYSMDEMRDAVWAAKDVFKWLDAVPSGGVLAN